MRRHPAVPYVLPFAVFIAILGLQELIPAVPVWVRFVVPMATIFAVSLPALKGRPSKPLVSILIGLLVFVIWVGPDVISPAWRHSFLFDNSVIGHPAGNTPPESKNDGIFLIFRVAISVVAVPVLEELFWRGWLMRWIVDPNHFERLPLGAYTPMAFWLVALLFASEHGSFWDVGLLAGIVYNWWVVRTHNLWDCIIAHAVTNAVLAAWVVAGNHWQYWL